MIRLLVAVLALAVATSASTAAVAASPHARHAPRRIAVGLNGARGDRALRQGRMHVRITGARRARGTLEVFVAGPRRRIAFAVARRFRLGRRGRLLMFLRLTRAGRRALRSGVARCRRTPVVLRVLAGRRGSRRRVSFVVVCPRRGRRPTLGGPAPHPGTTGEPAPGTPGGPARFEVGAAVGDFTPPAHGALPNDPADCAGAQASIYNGPRQFAFEEPYIDLKGDGHYDPPDPGYDPTNPTNPPNGNAFPGDPYLDCNHNGRWDGNLLGGGNSTPRFYTKVADPVTARAIVVSNGTKTIAVEVVDQEGLFSAYQQQIRDKVAADGVKLDNVFISATHDESAPDTLGLGGVNATTSGTNDYFVQYLIDKSAAAIEQAYRSMRPATIHYAEAVEPSNLRQCWSSYPFVDDTRMPILQAVGTDGKVIATLASVSQHAETLGFNDDPIQRLWVSGDWPHFFRQALEQRYGGVGVEMAGSVGSVETPEVLPAPISRTPQQEIDESHPAGCRTLFKAPGDAPGKANADRAPLGYDNETRILGEQLAGAVERTLSSGATPSVSGDIWGERRDVCVEIQNVLFAAAGGAGVFAQHPSYTDNCTVESQPLPNGTTAGTEVKSSVAAFRIGDGEFIALPGEVFPFTYFRSFLGPQDQPNSQYGMPPWPLPHMTTPWRFFDGLAEDMIGYIFPQGNAVGIPTTTNPNASDTDRFGCNHSDDSEAASGQAADQLGTALVGALDAHASAERVVTGRYVLPDGTVSRDPLGGPVLKCNVDQTYRPDGPAVAVDLPGTGVVHPLAWMSLSGRPQSVPDRDTRGYFDAAGHRVWLDVFPDVTVP